MSSKTCMVVVANPNGLSLTCQLAESFIAGLEEAGNKAITGVENSFSKSSINYLFQTNYPAETNNNDDLYRNQLKRADGVCLAFPWWCEMPPYPLVAWMQRNLIKDFAYKHDGTIKTPILNLPTQLLVTMGSIGECNLKNLKDGLGYTGLHVSNELVVKGAGPDLKKSEVTNLLWRARQDGLTFFK